ncbi:MAG: hypothetical protein SOY03_11880 [Bariatricus sp.]|nr:hypothetical protein [Bariatricus sp.]
MKIIDRLIMKASALLPLVNLFVISNEDGDWSIDGEKFSSLEDAERYIDGIAEKDNDYTIIINDAGPGIERMVDVYGESTVEIGNINRCPPDSEKSDEHGCKRGNRHEESEYNHTWV